MDLSTALWSDLPSEMVDQVLSYLPLPDLCRYRTVCKRWDRLMCDPKFGSLCAQNASKREASLIAMRYMTCNTFFTGWCFLDVNARRWYVFKEDGKQIRSSFPHGDVRMDGGLVCQYWGPDGIIVYNPVSQTYRKLPCTPKHFSEKTYFSELTLVVDNISQSFKIFLFTIPENKSRILNIVPLKLVYDSVTNEWKTSTSPVCIGSGSKLNGSGVIFQGYLYTIRRRIYFEKSIRDFRDEYTVGRYNLVKDAWEDLDVPIIIEISSACLVVSANRLFLVAWSKGHGSGFPYGRPSWSFQLSELKIPDMTREVLFEMSEADVVEGFETIEDGTTNYSLPGMSAFSFGNSILFMSTSTGISAAFDVVTRSWDRNFPPNPLEYLPNLNCSWAGEQMNLLLPCTPW
ncbi:hypothetical protein KC19_1G104000 [Ceratodon purpureus]|uniref:F-box domain-containing protein n=1 Tax=Ceratodon purpureus TaxID=3225 RepID=A0A8T0J5P4_CERPU|nr:hypothetical protein KC19_1G104000 [Ceratodon purpureus]